MKKTFLFLVALAAGIMMTAAQSLAATVVQGDISGNVTWTSDILVKGPVKVLSGAQLTINAGVHVYFDKQTIGALAIMQGGKLYANGTETNPVVFTSNQRTKTRGDWGGLIINGYAPINVPGGTKTSEGVGGTYGGSNADDSSGSLTNCRIEWTGYRYTAENEFNGLQLDGVGRGTTINNVHIYMANDDGIEFFGGTVNVKRLISQGSADDSIDWTEGYQGCVQYAIVHQKSDECDNGIEADNLEQDYDASPRSIPTIFNATFVGQKTPTLGGNEGWRLRRGTGAHLYNFIVQDFKADGIDTHNTQTFGQMLNGNLTANNNIFYNNSPNFATDLTDAPVPPLATREFMTCVNYGTLDPGEPCFTNNAEVNPLLTSVDFNNPDFRPAAASPAVNGQVPVAEPAFCATQGYIETTDHIGAVDYSENAADAWPKKKWTTYGDTDEDGVANYADNCPRTPNGPLKGICSADSSRNPGAVCTSNSDCQTPASGCGTPGVGTCMMTQADADSDGFGNVCDNCPSNCNNNQIDADGDGLGDVCDSNPGCGGGCGQSPCDSGC